MPRQSSPPARFQIKVADWQTGRPIVLADRARPAFRGQYTTLSRACLAMDNTIRRERNMPERIDWAGVGMYSRELDNSTPKAVAQ